MAPRVVIAGTKFGRVYLSAFKDSGFDFELAGILAQNSERSQACARHYNVPLFRDPGELPSDVDIGCVVVGTAVNGGNGRNDVQNFQSAGSLKGMSSVNGSSSNNAPRRRRS